MQRTGIDHVIAIAAHKLMFLLRLALVVVLAGNTLPSASFAMHGDSAATFKAASDSTLSTGKPNVFTSPCGAYFSAAVIDL